jgi:hypothetical protein
LFFSGGVNNERRECGYYSSEIKVIGSAHTATAGEWHDGSNCTPIPVGRAEADESLYL